jgi:hypothetical protein
MRSRRDRLRGNLFLAKKITRSSEGARLVSFPAVAQTALGRSRDAGAATPYQPMAAWTAARFVLRIGA